MIIVFLKDIRNKPDWLGSKWQKGNRLLIALDEPLQAKGKVFKAAAHIEAIIVGRKSQKAEGRLILYFSKGINVDNLGYGSRILTSAAPQALTPPANPGAFDYKRYAALHNLYHTIYISEKEWLPISGKEDSGFWPFIYSCREAIVSLIEKNMGGAGSEASIAEALIMGYKSSLDKDLLQSYSNTGLIHVIAISGMHLAIVNEILMLLFAAIRISRYKVLAGCLNVFCLWVFAFLTGGSASVLRSALMFSFVIAGKMLNKQNSVYNALASSAFLLLCYDPFMLWDTGFQLSYLAVLGLVLLQRPIYESIEIENKWIDKVWSLCAVTLSAQVFTLPACLFYFHQFPNYFLITNLIVVPLSTIILIAGLFLICFQWIPFVGAFVGKILFEMIRLMNVFVEWMGALPGSTWSSISLSGPCVLLLYLMIVFLSAWFLGRSKKFMVAAFSSALLFFAFRLANWASIQKENKIIIYSTRENLVIDCMQGGTVLNLSDSFSINHYNSIVGPCRIKFGANLSGDNLNLDSMRFFQFGTRRIAVVNSKSLPFPVDSSGIDLLIIYGNPKNGIAGVSALKPDRVVFASSNPLWKIEKWQKECERLHLSCYSIARNGALVIDL